MEAVDPSLVVECFKLYDIFTKGKTRFFEAGDGNQLLVDYPDTKNKLAEVFVICVREDAVEDARTKAIDVKKQLPCFVTA